MPTILLVEDEDLLRNGVQEMLELHDFHVIGAGDGIEALEWLEEAEIDLVKTWAKRREEYAHAEALRGRMPDGAKLVGKRPTRKWRDESDAVSTLQLAGVSDDDIYATAVRSPAQLEKMLTKTEKSLLADLVVKTSSGTVLAPLDDPRPAVDPNDASGFDDHSDNAD